MKLTTAFSALVGLTLSLASTAEARQRILLYTKTATFRHDSIPTAIDQIYQWSNTTWPGFDVVHTENQNKFEDPDWVNQFDALVFVSTSGNILSRNGQRNMISYIQQGGGFMGVHEASDCMYDGPWYTRMIGAQFDYHPEQCWAEYLVQNSTHPSVSWLKNGTSFWAKDEVYTWSSDPRIYGAQYVLAVNESTYKDPVTTKAQRRETEGDPHGIAWFKEGNLMDPVSWHVGGHTDDTDKSIPASGGDGRMFYTAMGHSNETWTDSKQFKKHFIGGLVWVLNSTTIRSYSNDSDAYGVGQPWEQRPPYVEPVEEDDEDEADKDPLNATTTSKQRNANSALSSLTTSSVGGALAASLVSALAFYTLV